MIGGLQEQLKAIEKKRIDDIAEYDKKKAKEQLEAKLNAASEYTSAGIGLLNTISELSTSISNKDVKSQEKAARRKFAVDKASALVTAGINTALAITKASPNPALMALAGLTGATQIGVIASKQFNSGASSSSAGNSIPSTSMSEPQANVTPSFNLFGSSGTANNQNASGQNNPSQNITVTAVVSETDMTYAQNRVNAMKSSASL